MKIDTFDTDLGKIHDGNNMDDKGSKSALFPSYTANNGWKMVKTLSIQQLLSHLTKKIYKKRVYGSQNQLLFLIGLIISP